jgi:hypothetical protein
MFENIPERTTTFVRDRIPQMVVGRPPEEKYLLAASAIIAEYSGKQYWDSTDPYIAWDRTAGSAEASLRVLQIGYTLFDLRNTAGFQCLCERLKTRDLGATFFELYCARSFWRAGYEILAKPESGVKKEDFDFTAVSENLTVNVECTALEEKTIL